MKKWTVVIFTSYPSMITCMNQSSFGTSRMIEQAKQDDKRVKGYY